MNKNKWLYPIFALSLPLLGNSVQAETTQTIEAESTLPAPASAEMRPEAKFRETGRLISFLLMQSHYSHPSFDDDLSKEAFKQLVKTLDPNRSYFYASDIAAFKTHEENFDDALRTGKIELAYDFFALFEERFRERYSYALKLLEKPFDFSVDEAFEYDRREAAWSASKAELNEIWRKRVKNDALSLKLAEQTDDQIKEKLTKRYESAIRRLSQTNGEDVFGYFMNAVNSAIDPHTDYYTPRQFDNFTINMSLKLQGIGAVLTQEDQFTKVVSIVNKGPAYKSGQLHKDDKIIGVGQGEEGEIVDVIGWRNDDVVDLIRGEAGSVVRLQVIPHTQLGDGAPQIVKLIREEIKLEDQAAKSDVLEIEQEGEKLNIGVIELPSFYSESVASNGDSKNLSSTTQDVARLIKELKSKDIGGLIIDLRNNGGGSLGEVVNLTGLFIDKGPVVQGKDSRGKLRVLKDTDGKVLYDGPLAVMVNGGSASASEIFAGAIQDYGRGIVIGENTFGKGTVQSVADLNQYLRDPETKIGALKLTVEKFYRITGESTQNKGVQPDIAFPTIFDHEEYGESSYDNALAWDTIRSANFHSGKGVGQFLPYLKFKHEERKQSDQEFSFLVDDINRAKVEREKKTVTLSYEQRIAKRNENDAIRLQRENLRRKLQGLEPLTALAEETEDDNALEQEEVKDKDILLKEAANILTDFIYIQTKPDIVAAFNEQQDSVN